MKNKKAAAILLAVALAFSAVGCGAAADNRDGAAAAAEQTETAIQSAGDLILELFSKRDLSGESEEYVTVSLSGGGATADGEGAAYADGVLTISAAGSYLLEGTLDGRIEIRVGDEDKVQLILSGAQIRSEGAAAICVLNADKCFLTLAEGTDNSVSAAGELAEIEGVKADGAIFAKCDLTVNGTGSLSVSCESGHGLVSKDDLKIASGTLAVDAAKQGLSGKDSVSIADGAVTIVAGTDGIHSENTDTEGKGCVNLLGGTLAIESGDDAVHAEETLTAAGGKLRVSRCYEGLEGKDIVISGGEIELNCSDDGLNAAGGNDGSGWKGFGGGGDLFAAEDASITISGGSLTIDAQGDGIDSNGDLTVSGGTILISGPTNGGNGGIDYNGSGVITGGTIVAASASGMAENFSAASTQPSMLVSFSGTLAALSEIIVSDESGRELLRFAPAKSYQCAVISAPEFSVGKTYTVSAGGESQSVSFSSVIYGAASGMGGFGGPSGFGGAGGFGGQEGSGMTPPEGLSGDFGEPPEGFDGGMTPPGGQGGFPGGDFGGDGSGRKGGRPRDGSSWNGAEGEIDTVSSATPPGGNG